MQIIERPSMALDLPGGTSVRIAAQRWVLDRWDGAPDPPGLGFWGSKPPVSVGGQRSCAELAVVDHLRHDGWDGVWVSAFQSHLRNAWFPAPA